MKKIFILLLLAFLIFFPACEDTSDELDAETQEAVEAIAKEATMIAYMGMFQLMSIRMDAMGVSRDIADPPVEIIGYEGVTISGTYDFQETGIANLVVTFTDYTNGIVTINGTVSLDITGNVNTDEYEMSITGELTGIYNGNSYVMDFNITLSSTTTEFTTSGYVQCNGYNVEFSITQEVS